MHPLIKHGDKVGIVGRDGLVEHVAKSVIDCDFGFFITRSKRGLHKDGVSTRAQRNVDGHTVGSAGCGSFGSTVFLRSFLWSNSNYKGRRQQRK